MDGPSAIARMDSPVGILTLRADEKRLLGVRIAGKRDQMPGGDMAHPIIAAAIAQLLEWFAGQRQAFDIPLTPPDSTEGERLRAGIASIPYGTTLTYGALAVQTGSVARAVGQACKTNPFPIIIPCHRVISTSGPEFYSGGDGPRTKTWLLDFEYGHLPPEERTRLI